MTNEFATRAQLVALIFNILAWVVLVLGALSAVFLFFGFLMEDEAGTAILVTGLTLVYTAVSWAGVQLASLVAGYIAHRS